MASMPSKFLTVINKDTIGMIKLLERTNYVCIIGNRKEVSFEAEILRAKGTISQNRKKYIFSSIWRQVDLRKFSLFDFIKEELSM